MLMVKSVGFVFSDCDALQQTMHYILVSKIHCNMAYCIDVKLHRHIDGD